MNQSPKEFMRTRRPERFSDTIITKKGSLNRSLLEYKLEVITSNSQELEFQNFCFKLAQLELAPNLRPQTGPSGGGDSKADTETYPVSEITRLNFWEGIANEKGERWAFAISANKDWINKVKKDVKGIADTGRDYKRIFFITNQFAKDKKRAEIEDGLTKDISAPVTILDRTWILDRVFQNNRQKLAIEELDLGEGLDDEVLVGPIDAERFKLFEKLNREIEEALSDAIMTIKVADKALDAALLARGMGKSKYEVDGLFDRAQRLAEQLSLQEHLYTIKYQKAWTSFFWYEDFEVFIRLVDDLQAIAESSSSIYTLERQYYLITLLKTMPDASKPSETTIAKKFDALRECLMEIVNDETRPSAAHQAKMLLALNNLFSKSSEKKDLNDNFREIGTILKDSERLIGFSYEESIGVIQENGDVFGEIPEYENLMNLVAEIDAKRKGEIPAAKLLLKYGLQHLESKRYYKAIEYIGKSLVNLYKKESKEDFVHALYFIAYAYEAIGLLWAARGSLIHAVSYSISDLRQIQEINEMQVKCCNRLKMLELRLGRVGYILEWHEGELILSQQLAVTRAEREAIYMESLGNFSPILGCLLLKTRPSDLSQLEKAPEIFTRSSLDFSGLALLYLLGGEKYLPEDYWRTIGDRSPTDFFNRWFNQPAQEDLPEYPEYYLSDIASIQSSILGTLFILETSNSSPGIEICEMIIASLEAFLSTAINMQVCGKVSEFKVVVKESEGLTDNIQLSNQTENGRFLEVLYKPFNPHLLSTRTQHKITGAVRDIIIRIVAETMAFSDPEKSLRELLVDQQVDQRSFNFLSPLVMLGNVLGHYPRRSIRQWYNDSDKEYPFDGITSRIEAVRNDAMHVGNEKAAKSNFDKTNSANIRSHQHMKTFSVINERLWDGYVWRGFAFAVDPKPNSIQSPTLYLMFDNRETAIEIFKEWKERFDDKAGEKIKISILKGIDADNPFWYKGLITSNIPMAEMKDGHTFVMMTKVSTMTPDNPRNLEGFLASYSRFGYFTMAPFFIDIKTRIYEPMNEWGFNMRELVVKNAWEIGVHDFEVTAIAATDNPILPKDTPLIPVLEVLKMKRERASNSV